MIEPTQVNNSYPICAACGSRDVLRDAFASWDKVRNQWELHSTYDYMICGDCESENIQWTFDTEQNLNED